MSAIAQLKANPSLILAPKFNLPQGVNEPTQIIQHLLNTGQVTQMQVNQVMNLRNSPMFRNMFN